MSAAVGSSLAVPIAAPDVTSAAPDTTRRTRHIHRWCTTGPSLLLLALVALVAGWTLGAPVAASASGPVPSAGRDGGPALVLSNEHLGMTREQVEAMQPAATADPVPHAAPPPVEPTTQAAAPEAAPVSDLQARADSLLAAAEAASERAREAAARAEALGMAVEAAEAGLIPGVGDNRDGPASYESCVEATIRRGLSYRDSDRMCRAVFGGTTP